MDITREQLVGMVFTSASTKFLITRIADGCVFLKYLDNPECSEWKDQRVSDALGFLNSGTWKPLIISELIYELWM